MTPMAQGDRPGDSWPLRRLRFLLTTNPSRAELRSAPRDMEVSFVPMEDVGDDGVLRHSQIRKLGDVYRGYTYFRDGDVVVAKITPCFENGKGAIATGLVNGVGFGTTELHVLRPGPGLDPRFLLYLTTSQPFRDAGTASMTGAAGQKRVPDRFIRDLVVAVPPLDEQCAIAIYLDEKTAAIDALIAKRERHIDLLEERRLATGSALVTSGLDASTPVTPTGIPWLGEVPAHWAVADLKRVLLSADYGISDSLDGEGDVPVLRMGNIRGGEVVMDDLKFVEDVSNSMLLRPMDLLFNRTNSLDLVGRMGIFRGADFDRVTFASYLVRFRTAPWMDPQYLCYLLNTPAVLEMARAMALPAIGQANLSPSRYGYLRICIPPIEEQRNIVAVIARGEAAVRRSQSIIKRQIDKLREYRQTLVSAAVTGRMPVRQEVPA